MGFFLLIPYLSLVMSTAKYIFHNYCELYPQRDKSSFTSLQTSIIHDSGATFQWKRKGNWQQNNNMVQLKQSLPVLSQYYSVPYIAKWMGKGSRKPSSYKLNDTILSVLFNCHAWLAKAVLALLSHLILFQPKVIYIRLLISLSPFHFLIYSFIMLIP